MAVLKIQDFGGIVPATGDRALPEGFATESINTWLYGSELRGIRLPEDVVAINPTTRKVFRIPQGTVGGDPDYPAAVPPPSYLGDSVWVQFIDPDTDIVRGQLSEDSYKRWYFCSPTAGPMYNTYARLLAGLTPYKLGVPGPETAVGGVNSPTISSITGGAAPVVTRAYLYTWVNEFGEESAPSLPVTGAGNANGIWNIAGIDDPAAVTGYANYAKKYLYRTITSASGVATYFRIGEVALGTTTYADNGATMTDAILAGNLQLESTAWALPPATLKGFITMPNGFLVGFDGNNLYMSESYRFHAWPAEYKQATEYPIVGLGVVGQTCVVCTQGFPATLTGVKPATVAFTKSTTNEPCMSRGSIVSMPDSVIYASQNGLVSVGPAGIKNVTKQLITRDDWLRDYVPGFLRAVRYQEGYLALRDYPDDTTPNSAFYLDPSAIKVALTELSDFDDVDNVVSDVWSGEVFLLDAGMIRRWDSPDLLTMPVLWRSKEFQYLQLSNFGAYAIYWDEARYATSTWGDDIIPNGERVRFRVLAGRTVVYDQAVPLNGKPIRLPSGFKSDIWQFEIRARAPVYSLHVANSIKELKGV